MSTRPKSSGAFCVMYRSSRCSWFPATYIFRLTLSSSSCSRCSLTESTSLCRSVFLAGDLSWLETEKQSAKSPSMISMSG